MVNYSENDWSLLSNLLENNINVSFVLKIVQHNKMLKKKL